MAGAGVGTDGTTFMFTVNENNWLGRGINLESNFNISDERIKGSLAVTNPNFNFTGNAVSAAVDVSNTDRTETSGYKSSNASTSLGTKFEQYEKYSNTTNYKYTFRNYTTRSL